MEIKLRRLQAREKRRTFQRDNVYIYCFAQLTHRSYYLLGNKVQIKRHFVLSIWQNIYNTKKPVFDLTILM